GLYISRNGLQGIRIEVFLEISFLAGRVLYPEQPVVQPDFGRGRAGNTYPVNRAFHIDAAGIVAAPAFGDVRAADLRNLPGLILYKIIAANDIGVLQPDHNPGAEPEELLRRGFHKILALDPQLAAEGDLPEAGAFVLRVVLRFQL